MNLKKLGVYSILLFLLVMPLMMGFVSAIPSGAKDAGAAIQTGIDYITEAGQPIFTALFGNSASGSDLAVQIMAFILVMVIIYGVLSGVNIFGDKDWINIVVGLIVALIGIRFMPDNFLETLAMPSTGLVALIFLGVPFIILFYLGKKIKSSLVRRAMWAVYAVMLLVLWIYNWQEGNITETLWIWLYPAFIVGCGVAFWFDATLQKWWNKGKAVRALEEVTELSRDKLIDQIEKLQNRLTRAKTAADRSNIIKEIEAKNKALEKL